MMDTEPLFTPENIAKRWQVSTAFIYKLVREKRIPYYHIGKSIRFSPSQIQEFLKTTMNGEYHRDRLKRNALGERSGRGTEGIGLEDLEKGRDEHRDFENQKGGSQ